MRYKVTRPAENGYSWFNVVDTESPVMADFAVVSIFRYLPKAEETARRICDSLNAEPGK